MSDLPNGWARAPFTEVVGTLPTSGHVVEANEYSSNGTIPVLTQGTTNLDGFTDDRDRAISSAQDLIVFGDHTRAIKLAQSPFAIGPNTKVLQPTAAIDGRFLYYQLPTILPPSRGYGRHYQFLAKATVAIAPQREQARIVAAVEEAFSRLDAGVAALDRVQRNLKRLRAAILEAAVTGNLVDSDPAAEPAHQLMLRISAQRQQQVVQHPYSGSKREPKQPKTTDLPILPATWCWATIDQLCSRVVDGVHKKPNYVDNGIPFVTVRNLTAGPGISFEHLHFVTEEDHASFIKRTHPQCGDLLLSKDGTLGVVRAIRDEREFSIFVSVALMKPVDHALTDYLELALSSPVVQRQMVPKGSGLQHIHLEDLREDCVPIPPLAEQQRIADEARRQISLVDALEAEFDRWSTLISALRSSTLAAAFTGKLVPQDPHDEPASTLLERIAGERATVNSHNHTRIHKPRTRVPA